MTIAPKETQQPELSVRVKSVPRVVGGVKVYVTKSRSVPVKLGKGVKVKKRAEELASAGVGAPSTQPTRRKKAKKPVQKTS